MRRGDRVLVVLLAETRAWELTYESLRENLLEELGADLALCVGDHEEPNPLYDRAKYVWRLEEPEDWAATYDRATGGANWRVLLEVHEQLLGGIADLEHPQVGSGAIGLYFRRFLKESIEREGVADAYDWLIVTRSDFMRPVPHPHIRHLSNRHIYVLDGEGYGGVPDRHFIVPRRHLRRFLHATDPVFDDPEGFKRRLEHTCAERGWDIVNPERVLALLLAEQGLWGRVRYLPYFQFTVRGAGDSTTWSPGMLDKEAGYYVKYPGERERTLVSRRFLRDQGSWRRYLALVRGVPLRRRLREAYPADPHQPPFPSGGERVRSWGSSGARRLDRAAAAIGGPLRRVPGLAAVLDARLRRSGRRGVRGAPTRSGPRATRG